MVRGGEGGGEGAVGGFVEVDEGYAAFAGRVDPGVGHPCVSAVVEGFGHGEPEFGGGVDEVRGVVGAPGRRNSLAGCGESLVRWVWAS